MAPDFSSQRPRGGTETCVPRQPSLFYWVEKEAKISDFHQSSWRNGGGVRTLFAYIVATAKARLRAKKVAPSQNRAPGTFVYNNNNNSDSSRCCLEVVVCASKNWTRWTLHNEVILLNEFDKVIN